MERATKENTIGGRDFRTQKFDPEHSLRLMTELGAILGGPLGQAVGAFAQGDGNLADRTMAELLKGVDGDLLGAAISNVFTGLHKVDAPTFLKKVLVETQIKIENSNGDPVWLDVEIRRDFRDDLFAVFELAQWVLGVNYSNFSKRLAMFAGKQAEQVQAMANSLKGASGN